MTRLLLPLLLSLAFLGAVPAVAQDAPSFAAEPDPDPFGRETPRGALDGLLAAFVSGTPEEVVPYLDLSDVPEARRAFQGRVRARRLQTALDTRAALLPGFRVSAEPAGITGDGLPPDLDVFAQMRLRGETLDLTLRRSDVDGRQVWQVSDDTLALVAELGPVTAMPVYERFAPDFLRRAELWGTSLAGWIAALLAAIGALGLGIVAVHAIFWIVSRPIRPLRHGAAGRLTRPMRLPAGMVLAAPIFQLLALGIGVPIVARAVISPVMETIAYLAIAWMILRLIHAASEEMLDSMTRREQLGAVSVVAMARRALFVVVILITAVLIAGSFGLNLTGWFAALGIGGIAIALGAQKTIEHIVGGVSIIADQPIRVGDFCKVDALLGTVEDIGLRSTRIRTLDNTLLTIPNGDLSSARIENFAGRTRFLWQTTIGLRYETTPAQMREILRRLEVMLQAEDRVAEGFRVRFVGFGPSSLDVEVFAYLLASDHAANLAIRQDLNLEIMAIVDACGSGFAFPSQTVYISRDTPPHRAAG